MNGPAVRARLLASIRLLSERDQADVLQRALTLGDTHAPIDASIQRSPAGVKTALASIVRASFKGDVEDQTYLHIQSLVERLNAVVVRT